MELQQHIQNQMCHCFKGYFADLVEATHMYAARTYFLNEFRGFCSGIL